MPSHPHPPTPSSTLHAAWWAALIALLFLAVTPATASPGKLSRDLLDEVTAATGSANLNWSRTVGGVRYVKVLIVGQGTDPDMRTLRAQVLARGGSVYMRYVSVSALSALLPAREVLPLAARADVHSISANRLTERSGVTMTPKPDRAGCRA